MNHKCVNVNDTKNTCCPFRDLSSVPGTHVAAQNHLQPQLQETQFPLWPPSMGTYTYLEYTQQTHKWKEMLFSKTICFTQSFTVKSTHPMLDCRKLLWVIWFSWKRDLPSALALPEVPRSGLALQHSSTLTCGVSSRSLQDFFFYNSFFFLWEPLIPCFLSKTLSRYPKWNSWLLPLWLLFLW